jgi:PAS domain S-box-containing protein
MSYHDKTKEELIEELNSARKQNEILFEQNSAQDNRLQMESQQIYSSAFNAVTQGIVITNSEQLINYVNPAFTAITGYSLNDCLGRNCRFLQDAKTNADVTKSIREALAAGRKFSGVILNYRKDGTCFWNELSIDPVKNSEGQITHFVGITNDITDRREAERILVRNAKLLDESQSIGRLGGWEFDLLENHLYWTAETYRIHETSPEEFNPTVDAGVNYFLPESKQKIEQALELAMTKGIGYDLELETYTTKGNIIIVRTTCDVTIAEGKPVKLTGIFQDITARKAEELKLVSETEKAKSNEEKYRILFEQSSVGIAQVDTTTGRFLKVNEKCSQILGYSIEEMLLLDFPSITHPDDLKSNFEDFKALGRGDIHNVSIEKRYIHKKGHVVWVDFSATLVREIGDSTSFNIAVINDISKRKQAEIQQEFERLDKQALINSTSDLIWSISKDFKLIAGNSAYIESTRKYSTGILKRGDLLLTPEYFSNDLLFFWKNIYESALLGKSYNGEFFTPKTNEIQDSWFELTVNPIWNNDEVHAIACFARNITDRKKNELELAKSFKELSDYQFSLDQSTIVAITDKFGTINYINENFCEICKYSREELIGQDHRIINSGHHPKEFFSELWATISNGNIWRAEIKNKAKDGTFYWVDTTIVPFLDEENKPFQYLSIRFDITSRKEAEFLIEAQNTELIKTNTELDRFVYSASHDLRAPLKTILGLINILNEEITDNSLLDILSMMDKTVLKLDKFIEDILDYSRNTKLEVTHDEIDFEELINEIKLNIESTNNIDLIIENEHKLKFYSDKNRLLVILNNLISNSTKYFDPTKKSFIKFKLRQFSEHIELEVEDNGIGIENQNIDKVFEMFYRATTLSKGAGLGLYIVKENVHKLGGSISLESQFGIGTKVLVQLPNQKND